MEDGIANANFILFVCLIPGERRRLLVLGLSQLWMKTDVTMWDSVARGFCLFISVTFHQTEYGCPASS